MASIRFLSVEDVLVIQQNTIANEGGAAGLRDAGLLESAVLMPQQQFGGEYLHPDIASMASATSAQGSTEPPLPPEPPPEPPWPATPPWPPPPVGDAGASSLSPQPSPTHSTQANTHVQLLIACRFIIEQSLDAESGQVDHRFWPKPITESERSRSPILAERSGA